jgi:hypothetical protein
MMQRVEVEWIDSVADHGWSYKSDALSKATAGVMRCTTIGYILREDDECLVLCMGEQPGSESVLSLMQIPRESIRAVHPLRRR